LSGWVFQVSLGRNVVVNDHHWIMKTVAMASVSSIEVHSLFRQQPYHYHGYRHTVRNEKQIKMVWNQRPGGTRCGSICRNMTELITEGLSIDIIPKNISVLNCPAYDMMQASRGVYEDLAE